MSVAGFGSGSVWFRGLPLLVIRDLSHNGNCHNRILLPERPVVAIAIVGFFIDALLHMIRWTGSLQLGLCP